MTPPLLNQVQALARFRAELATVQERQRAAETAFKLAHMDDLKEIARLKELVELTEHGIRTDAVALAVATGSKHPAPGVEVKKCTRILYDEAAALRWATTVGICLTLDVKAFEALMLKSADIPSFVQRNDKTPVATIARDLPKALGLATLTGVPAIELTPEQDAAAQGFASVEAMQRWIAADAGKGAPDAAHD